MLTFCNAIEPPLFPIRCTFGYLAYGEQLLWEKTLVNLIFCLTPICLFAQDLIINVICCCFSLISWHSLITLFVYSCLICLSLSVMSECLFFSEHSVKIHLILHYISLKSQWLFIWLSVIIHLNFNELSLNSFIILAI